MLSDSEKSDALRRIFPNGLGSIDRPIWLVNAGWKDDWPTKRWPTEFFQEVVNATSHRVQWVQIGEPAPRHHHPPLQNVVTAIGLTGPPSRDLAKLVYHSDGVLCGVTFLMHLAAAVDMPPAKGGPARARPAVVLLGGREPLNWVQYPGHTVLHTLGQLPCCQRACWKRLLCSATAKDDSVCLRVDAEFSAAACMSLISPVEATRAIERYLDYGAHP